MYKRSIYLDYAAATPVDPRVMRAMQPYFSEKFANAGAAYRIGQEAFRAISHSREIVAGAFGCESEGVIFTASATEANNLALRGVVAARAKIGRYEDRKELPLALKKDSSYRLSSIYVPHIVTTAIEHDSVFEVCRLMEEEGLAEVTYLGVSRDGIVSPAEIAKALRPETILVSVIYANNEIGTIQPLFEISKIIQDFKKRKFQIPNYKITQLLNYPLFHTDAVQAVQFLDCKMKRLGVDLLTASSHKIYGPKGAAALLMRNPKHEARNSKQIPNSPPRRGEARPTKLGGKLQIPANVSNLEFRISDLRQLVKPIVVGGGQERGLRSGTENVPAIVGFGKAVELALARRAAESKRLGALRDYFIGKLLAHSRGVALNGSAEHRLPNNVNVSLPGRSADVMVTMLDRAGIAASAGSACSARAVKSSRVLQALGISQELARSALRFSLGRYTTKRDLDYVVKTVVQFLR